MNRMNRRRFVAVTSVTATSVLLVACGNEPLSEEALNPTQIPDVPGAPPTIAPRTSTPGAQEAADAPAEGEGTAAAGGDSGSAGAITIEAFDDFSFNPNQEVEVAPGQTVTLINQGFAQHNLVVDEWAIETPLLNGGESGETVIPDDVEVGSTVEFYCSVPGHKESGMVGTFVVVEASAVAPADEQATGEEAAPAEEGSTGGAGEAILIEAHDDFSFSPNEVEVSPGQTVTLQNKGFAQHDLVVDEWGIATELLNSEQTGDVVIPDDVEVGSSVTFYCSVPGHRQSGMEGTFTVVEAGSSAAAAPAGETQEEATAAAEEEAPAAASGGSSEPILIEAHDDFSFSPNEVEVSPGQTVTLHNKGFAQHDLVVDEWGIATELLNNEQSGDVVIPDDVEVGSSVEFYCSVPGHKQSGMVGTFTVVEAGSSAAAPAGEGESEATAATEEEAPAAAGGGSGEAILIEAHDDFSFSPSEVEVMPGQTVTVHNMGFAQHDLVVDEWDIRTELLNNDQTGDVTIPDDVEVGSSVEFYCSVPGHKQSGMVGTFTVVEGGSSTAAAPAGEGEATAAAGEAGSGNETGGVENTPQAVTVVGTQWEFQPAEFEIAPGGVITFQNETGMSMGLSSEEWDENGSPMMKSVPNGSFGEFTVPDDAPVGETIEFKSNLTEAEKQGMVGKITIVAPGEGSATPAASPQSDEGEGESGGSGEAILIEAHDDFSFSPNEVEVSPGQTVTLHNLGFAQHDLVVDDWDIRTELLNNDETGDVVIPDDVESGSSVEFYCSVPGHKQSGMVGTFTVK